MSPVSTIAEKIIAKNVTGKLETDQDFKLAFRKLVDDFNGLVKEYNKLVKRVRALEGP